MPIAELHVRVIQLEVIWPENPFMFWAEIALSKLAAIEQHTNSSAQFPASHCIAADAEDIACGSTDFSASWKRLFFFAGVLKQDLARRVYIGRCCPG